VDARAFQALDDAVHKPLAQELTEIARLGEALDQLHDETAEALDQVYRRIEALESKLGRRPSVPLADEIWRLRSLGVSVSAIATTLGVARGTVVKYSRDAQPALIHGMDGKQRRPPRPSAATTADSLS
jgi:hypothetical protein